MNACEWRILFIVNFVTSVVSFPSVLSPEIKVYKKKKIETENILLQIAFSDELNLKDAEET